MRNENDRQVVGGDWSSGETSSNENEYVTSDHEPEAVNSNGTSSGRDDGHSIPTYRQTCCSCTLLGGTGKRKYIATDCAFAAAG